MGRRRKGWSYTAGQRPHSVTVYEREPGGPLYVRVWDPSLRDGRGNWVRRSLGHRDKDRATAFALEQAAALKKGHQELRGQRLTLARVFALYRQHRTATKTDTERTGDQRRFELWSRVLAGSRDPHRISLAEWEAFIRDRSKGRIDARGREVPAGKRKPVRPRTVESDCLWLRWVFNWASTWQLPSGGYLMRENPIRGFKAPREKNPKRPVATEDRYEALRMVSDEVTMDVTWHGKRRAVRSHLSEILDIVNGTGRRLGAVCGLRYHDLRLEEGPYGSIRWPADTDKMGYESMVPVSPVVRAAIDRVLEERPGIGSAPLFPSPQEPGTPLETRLASKWLRKAEKLAGLETQDGTLWHAFRRKWATERKHLPDVDVAAAGGWKSLVALKQSYQHADAETMLRVVLEGGELREQA